MCAGHQTNLYHILIPDDAALIARIVHVIDDDRPGLLTYTARGLSLAEGEASDPARPPIIVEDREADWRVVEQLLNWKRVAVIGGGDSAAEEALFLTRFASKVYLVHRRDELRASKIMSDRATSHEKIEMVWNSVPVEVEGVEANAVSGLKVRDVKSGEERVLPVKGVFVAIGHLPNTGPFAPPLPVDENGYFQPAAGSQVRTDIPGVYVAGDCADHVYRQAITAAGMGCQAAIEAERWLAGHDG
jgi:thioredoxin reductase